LFALIQAMLMVGVFCEKCLENGEFFVQVAHVVSPHFGVVTRECFGFSLGSTDRSERYGMMLILLPVILLQDRIRKNTGDLQDDRTIEMEIKEI
jgi:hypothetical protein